MTARARRCLAGATAGIFLALFAGFDGLRFPVRKDETHFWPTSQAFAREGLPSLDFLRHYEELNTPLPFFVFGVVERWTGVGVFGGRLINFLLVLSLVGFIAAGPGALWPAAPLAAAGLFLCPYTAFVSTHLYTDPLAMALSVAGLALHLRGRFWAAAACFVFGIAARQYAATFPAGLAAAECWAARGRGFRPLAPWLAPALAAGTLGGWYAFFGGPGPVNEIANQNISTGLWHPDHGLYLLSTVGFYFVLAEAALFRRVPWKGAGKPEAWVAAAVVAAFLLWPPLENRNYGFAEMGFLDKAARRVFPDFLRAGFFGLLAVLAALRLRAGSRGWWILGTAVVLTTKAHIAWDKYALLPLSGLWFLRSRGADDSPIGDVP